MTHISNYIPGDPFAYRGKHRKSRSRRGVKIAALAVPMTFAGLALVGATPLAAHAAVTVTPGQEWAACTAAAELHGHQVQHDYVPSAAWWATWRAANHADREMRRDIHRWMRSGRGYWRVWHDCNPDA